MTTFLFSFTFLAKETSTSMNPAFCTRKRSNCHTSMLKYTYRRVCHVLLLYSTIPNLSQGPPKVVFTLLEIINNSLALITILETMWLEHKSAWLGISTVTEVVQQCSVVYHEEYDDGTDQDPYGTGVTVSHVSMDLAIRTGYLQRSAYLLLTS